MVFSSLGANACDPVDDGADDGVMCKSDAAVWCIGCSVGELGSIAATSVADDAATDLSPFK